MKQDMFDVIARRIKLIREFVNDPYKAPEVRYELVKEVMRGEHD